MTGRACVTHSGDFYKCCPEFFIFILSLIDILNHLFELIIRFDENTGFCYLATCFYCNALPPGYPPQMESTSIFLNGKIKMSQDLPLVTLLRW